MEARVAVLEQIAADTRETLRDIKDNLLRVEESHKGDFRRLEEHQRGDFRLLLSAGAAATIGLAALMAHGFHWF
jgi:hypothetical protein